MYEFSLRAMVQLTEALAVSAAISCPAMRVDLPTGTVTFFFSDIEGSTRLAQRLGPSFRQVIDDAPFSQIVRAVAMPTMLERPDERYVAD